MDTWLQATVSSVAFHGLFYRRQWDKRTSQNHQRCARKDSTYIKAIAYILKGTFHLGQHFTRLHRMAKLAMPTPQQTCTDLELPYFLKNTLVTSKATLKIVANTLQCIVGVHLTEREKLFWATSRILNAALEVPV